MGRVFAEMSSWTALTWNIDIKQHFGPKYEEQIFWDLHYEDFKFKSDGGKCILKEIEHITTINS